MKKDPQYVIYLLLLVAPFIAWLLPSVVLSGRSADMLWISMEIWASCIIFIKTKNSAATRYFFLTLSTTFLLFIATDEYLAFQKSKIYFQDFTAKHKNCFFSTNSLDQGWITEYWGSYIYIRGIGSAWIFTLRNQPNGSYVFTSILPTHHHYGKCEKNDNK